MIKTCERCGQPFDTPGNSHAKYCPTCRPEAKRERERRYREANHEKEAERHRQYYEANRERELERGRRRREANREQIRERDRLYARRYNFRKKLKVIRQLLTKLKEALDRGKNL